MARRRLFPTPSPPLLYSVVAVNPVQAPLRLCFTPYLSPRLLSPAPLPPKHSP